MHVRRSSPTVRLRQLSSLRVPVTMGDTQVLPGLWENETCREGEPLPSTADEPLADLLCEALPDFSAPLFLGAQHARPLLPLRSPLSAV